MLRTWMEKRSSPNYSHENLHTVVSNFANQKMSLREIRKFEEGLKRFKENEQGRVNKIKTMKKISKSADQNN